MKKQTILISALAATTIIGAIGTVLLAKVPTNKQFYEARADEKSITLDSTKLAAATFETLDLEQPGQANTDIKFRIPLENDCYIDGALVYSDCGHQYVGANLSEEFGLESTSNDAFNFNFLFSFEKAVKNITVNYTYKEGKLSGTSFAQRLRYSNRTGEFYTLVKENYSKIKTYPEADFYNGKSDGDAKSLNTSTTSDSIGCSAGGYTSPIVDFNLNTSSNLVPANDKVTFQITSITFTYECK